MIIGEMSGLIGGLDYRSNYYGGWSGNENANWGTSLNVVRYTPNPAAVTAVGDNETYTSNNQLTSTHSGGVQIALADGSSRFISNNTDIETLRRLASKGEGAVIGDY